MRTGFIIFLSVFILIYISGNLYLYRKLKKAVPEKSAAMLTFRSIFMFLSISFILAEVLEKTGIYCCTALFIAGGLWLAFLLYSVLMYLTADIIKLILHLSDMELIKKLQNKWISISRAIPVISLLIVTAGAINAANPVTRIIDIKIKNSHTRLKELNIAIATDIHLGAIIGKSHLTRLVNEINRYNPHIVLFPGDFFDESPQPVIENHLGGLIESIRSKYGVYACTGNHEYIGGVEPAVDFMKKHKIKPLRDEAITMANSFILAGRDDYSKSRFFGKKLTPLSEVLKNSSSKLPVIVMDHQPRRIKESIDQGVDLHLSGHTHNGQLWPFNYLTSMLFGISNGYEKFGNTHIYVSPGYGTWGPPVRTTARPELVIIQIRFVK